MRYKYDAKTGMLIVRLGKGRPDFAGQKGNIILHHAKYDMPIGIEMLDAGIMIADLVGAILDKGKKRLMSTVRDCQSCRRYKRLNSYLFMW